MSSTRRSSKHSKFFRQKSRLWKRQEIKLQFEALESRQLLNAVPLVNNDLAYSTSINTALSISLVDSVLNNDFDADSPSLSASKTSDPTNGTLVFNSDGTFTYTPNTNFEGVDTFSYEASDGTNTSVEAMAQITVGQGLSGALNGDNISSNLLHDGVLSFSQPIASGLELVYRSDTLPVVLVPIETFLTDGTAIPDSITAELVIDGVSSGQVVFNNNGLQTEENLRFVLRAITPNTSTGMYDWTITATLNYSGSANITRTFTGSEAVVNRASSEFGSGFWLDGLDRIYDSAAGALLVNGDGTTLWFEKDGSNYLGADGDLTFSTLVQNTGSDFTLTDKWGDTRSFDSSGYITEIKRLNNSNPSFTFAYGTGNLVSKITDEFGREATFTYNRSKLISVNDFYGRTSNFGFTLSRLDSVTVADETATGYVAPTWTFDYVQIGAQRYLDEITDPAGHTTEYIYDQETRRIEKINNADHTPGDPSTWQLFPAIGEGVAIASGSAMLKTADVDARYIDENGNTVRFATNRFGDVVSHTDGLDAVTEFGFDNQGMLYQITGADPDDGGNLLSPVTSFGFNSFGDLVYTENPDGTTTSATYDTSLHLPTQFTNELGNDESFDYDTVGNLETYTDLAGNDWTYTYDSYGNVLTETTPDPDGTGVLYQAITTTYEYDPTYYRRLLKTTWDNNDFQEFTYTTSDQVATSTDELGNVTSYDYDPLDRLIEMTLPDPDGAGGGQLAPIYTYVYGANLLLASETDPLGNTTSYNYDERGRLIKTTLPDPDGQGTLNAPEYDWTYDRVGNLIGETRPEFDGVSIVHEYDENNQLTSTTGPVANQVSTFDYDDLGRLISTTDASGRTIAYEYDARNRLTKIIDDPDGGAPLTGPTTEFGYDAAGNLTSETDPLGRTTTYIWFASGLLESVTKPDPDRGGGAEAPVTEYEYDDLGRLIKTTTPSGRDTQNQYNIFGQVTKFIGLDPDSSTGPLSAPETDYGYNERGQLTSVTDTLGNTTSYSYDNLGRILSITLPDPDGGSNPPVDSFTYDAVGNVLTSTDALGRVTSYAYDDLYRLTTVTQPDPDAGGNLPEPVWSYQFNDRGLLESTTDPMSHVVSHTYDSAGRRVSTTNAGNNTTNYTYDLLNRIETVTTPDPDGAGTAYQASVTTYNYDIYSRLTSVVDAANESTVNTYDVAGQLLSMKDASGNTTRWAYDELGRMTMETDERGFTRSFNYNKVDRLVRRVDRNGSIIRFTNSGLDTVESWYERTDSPTIGVATTTQGGSGTDEVQTVTLNNLSDGGFGGIPDHFRLSFGGQVIEPLPYDASAADLETALEELESIDDVQVSLSNDIFTITFVGDQAGVDVDELMADVLHGEDGDLLHEITVERDALYRTTGIDDDFADYDYTLDNLGRVIARSESIDGFSPTIDLDFEYDAVGNRTSVTASIGNDLDYLTNYTYDNIDRLSNISQQSQSGGNAVADKLVKYVYNSLGQVTHINRFEALTGTNPSLRTINQYDTANRLLSRDHKHIPAGSSATLLHGYDYSYDAMDRFVSIDSSRDGLSTFTFDAINQLTDADHAAQADEDYNYDATGNRTGSGFTIGDDNLTLSDGIYDYEYDNEGNRTKRTEISSDDYELYDWDHRNRLTGVTGYDSGDTELWSVVYSYDAFNRLVRRTYDADGPGGNGATDQFFAGFDGKHGTLEFDGATGDDLTDRYLWSGEELVANEVVTSTSSAGEIQWALTDHVMTIRDIAKWNSGSGEFEVANHRVYNSFGELISETDATVDLEFGFTSQWLDEATEMGHHLNRWFDASLGKWLSDDPLGFAAGDVNLQRYVDNRPLMYVDPTGLAKGAPQDPDAAMNVDANQGTIEQHVFGGGGITAVMSCVACHNPVIMNGGSFRDLPPGHVLGASAFFHSTSIEEMDEIAIRLRNNRHEVFDWTSATAPVVSDIRDIVEAVSGNDLRSGRELTPGERDFTIKATLIPFVSGAGVRKIPDKIYRGGRYNASAAKDIRVDHDGVSFRDSLSNPIPKPEHVPLRPGKPYIEVDTSQLPPGSVIPDNIPPGHVTVTATVEEIVNAIVGGGKFPKK